METLEPQNRQTMKGNGSDPGFDHAALIEIEEDTFVGAVAAAIDALPGPYRSQLASVAIVVQDEPDPDQLTRVHARGLLGLYQGVPRTTYGADHIPTASKITLFRGPLMRAYPTPDALMRGVRETLDHEVAHHLGINDERLRTLRNGRRH